MREYAKVAPQFWIGETGRKLRTLGADAQVVAFYLITSPHANMLGLYYLPLPLLAHETGLLIEEALEGLQRVSEVGFASYDAPSEWVWVHEMARYQIGEVLKQNDNRVIGINREYHTLPNNPFLNEFYRKYGHVFHIDKARGSEAPLEPLRSQEQEKEQEQEEDNSLTTFESSLGTVNGVHAPSLPLDPAVVASPPKEKKPRVVAGIEETDWLWQELQHYTDEFDVEALNDEGWWANVSNSFQDFSRGWVALALADLASWLIDNPKRRPRNPRGWKSRMRYSLNRYYDKHMRRQSYGQTTRPTYHR